MALLNEEDEVVDLTELRKRGILKEGQAEPKANIFSGDSRGFVDLGSSSSGGAAISPSSSDNAGVLSFLDDLAGAGSTESAGAASSGSAGLELQGLKNKIEDLEYKLDRLMEKVERLEGG